MIRLLRVFFLIVMLAQSAAFSDQPDLSEAEIRTRTDSISRTLRCVVCQNQSIYDSNAPLAVDMRRLVEERVRAGDTDDEVREYLRGPYGDFILMRPPFQLNTLLLWLGPIFLVLALGVWYLKRGLTPKSATSQLGLSEQERLRLDAAFHDEPNK